jgi:hypothetical protein
VTLYELHVAIEKMINDPSIDSDTLVYFLDYLGDTHGIRDVERDGEDVIISES